MAYVNQFSPSFGTNQTILAEANSQSITVNSQAKALRLVNDGSNTCFVRVGSGNQTATTADLPVRPNSEIIIRKAEGQETVAFISEDGTTLYVQTGEGGV